MQIFFLSQIFIKKKNNPTLEPIDEGRTLQRRVRLYRMTEISIIKLLYKFLFITAAGDHSRGRPEGSPFNSYYTMGLLHFTLDTYLILLSVKQGGIKYHF